MRRGRSGRADRGSTSAGGWSATTYAAEVSTPKRARKTGAGVLLAVLAIIAVAQCSPSRDPDRTGVVDPVATVQPAAHMPWTSGIWVGGEPSAARVAAFAEWRGARVDTVTTYPTYKTWDDMRNSEWSITVWNGFAGRLVYGLPLLPDDKDATYQQVIDGSHDDVFAGIASLLVDHGRGNSFVRVGLEANGDWFRWGAKASTAAEFKAAFQHVVQVMRAAAPKLTFVFDIACGRGLDGSSSRLAPLTALYPGDDVVDVVGCDSYDSFTARANNDGEWKRALAPPDGAGMQDVADFARSHGKKFAIPEWGLTAAGAHGSGDNPYYIGAMHAFFTANAATLAFENYFNEPNTDLDSSLWNPDQNPKAAERYAQLWHVAS